MSELLKLGFILTARTRQIQWMHQILRAMDIFSFMNFWTLRFWTKWRCRAWKMTCTNPEWCNNSCQTTSPTRTNQNKLIPHSVAPTSLQSCYSELIDIHIKVQVECECLAINMRLNRTMNETKKLECLFRAEISLWCREKHEETIVISLDSLLSLEILIFHTFSMKNKAP